MDTAEELAKQQRSISVAEFFEKNRQILGFDSAPRALITCVKEAVDNSLDACEDAGILPDIFVQIKRAGELYRVIVEDNGPGIVPSEIPRVFAKLLYGSRFHVLRQSRGQQGIGISAAVLYSQLTTGKPTRITSRTSPERPARYVEVMINTAKNEPEIIKEENIDWERPRGTRVELDIEGSYVRGRRQSVYSYLKSVAIVNPHARITFVEPDGSTEKFERSTELLPKRAYEIKPHPSGIELGELTKMLRYTERRKLSSFLKESFSSIGNIAAQEILQNSGLDPSMDPRSLDYDQSRRLFEALRRIKIKSPPVDCLSPIGEDLIRSGLAKEYRVDFIATVSRPVAVHSGNPFVVEAGIGFGGDLDRNGRVEILRFANRVPLIYQQGACAITHAIEGVSWKSYGLDQPGGGLPVGPAVILVHVASTNIPFTSESKDAIADIPEILAEIDLAMKEIGRKLRRFLALQETLSERREKEEIIGRILPKMADKLADMLGLERPDISRVVARIMGNVLVKRDIEQENGRLRVCIEIENNTSSQRSFKLHEIIPLEAEDLDPPARRVDMGDRYDYQWKIAIRSGERMVLRYTVRNHLQKMPEAVVEGLEPEIVTGARVLSDA